MSRKWRFKEGMKNCSEQKNLTADFSFLCGYLVEVKINIQEELLVSERD